MRDDLIPEEHEIVYEAMGRLTDKEMFDRSFRLRRAVQLNMTKETLGAEQWIPIEKV
jgi:ubiquinol-cytochrome c reductase subunit 7